MQNRLKEFFGFTKKELNGLLVFCMLLMLVLLAPVIASWFRQPESYHYDQFKKEIAAFKASEHAEKERYSNRKGYPAFREAFEKENSSPVYFRFDPNNLPESSWQKLGLSKGQIRVIKNYEAKGGKFRRKEDLKKIWSIGEDDYQKLGPYIVIPQQEQSAFYKKNSYRSQTRLKSLPVIVELNSADSAALETVRGIGPVLASRIIKYRNRLGGFYSKEQLHEVYGIDSARYTSLESQLDVNRALVQKLNLNTATFEELRRHPYLSYKQMNAIIQYRKQHGPYSDAGDLRKIAILDEEILRKIAPYLVF